MRYKSIWIGGIIGLFIPWSLFFVAYINCHINKQTDCEFALGILFGLARFFSLVGLILGIIIGALIKIIFNKKEIKKIKINKIKKEKMKRRCY